MAFDPSIARRHPANIRIEEVTHMDTTRLLLGAALGAGLVYIFDPQSGRRRRSLVRDKLMLATNKTRDALDTTARDIANRSRGIVAATRTRFASEEIDDARLRERVRAKLGRVCSHPRAIDVAVSDADVALRGPILAQELPAVLSMVKSVPGVRSVNNQLEIHESAEGVPSLQGEGNVPGPSLDILQRNWAPATQALVAAAGVAATGLCLAAYSRRTAHL
jgi:osmotically-inducible protein OsmY